MRDFLSYLIEKFAFPVLIIIAIVCVYLGGNAYAEYHRGSATTYGCLAILAFVLAFTDLSI